MVSESPSTWTVPQARQSNESMRLVVEKGKKSHHSHPMHHEQAGTSLVFGVKPGRADWGRCSSSGWQQSQSRWSKREQGRDGYACQKCAKQAHLVDISPCVHRKCCFRHYTSTQLGHEMAYVRRDSHQGLLQLRGSPQIKIFSSCIYLEGGPANAIMRRWLGGRPCEGGDRIRLAASLPPPLGFSKRPRRAVARCCEGGRGVPCSFRLDAPSSPSSHASPTVGPASFPHASPLRAKLAPQLPPP